MFNQFFLFTTTAWVLAAMLALPLIFAILKSRKRQWSTTLDAVILLIFLVFFLGSFAFRLQPSGFIELIAFTIGPVGYLVLHQEKQRDALHGILNKLVALLVAFAGVCSVYGIIKFIPGHSPRLAGLFTGVETYTTYPNAFALFLIAVLPLHLILLSPNNKKLSSKKLKFIIGLSALVNLTALFLTFSRGAYLAVCGGLACFAAVSIAKSVYQKRAINWWQPLGTILLLGTGILAGMGVNYWHSQVQPDNLREYLPIVENISERVSDQEAGADQSTDERQQFWLGSLSLIKQHPLFGVGSDGFKSQYPLLQQSLLATSTHPHNLFLKIAVENGLAAAIAFVVFLGLIFFRAIKAYWRSKSTSWQPAALLMSFLFMQLHLLVDYNINAMFLWGIYWLVILLAGSQGKPSLVSQSAKLGNLLKFVYGIILLIVLGVNVFHISNYKQQKTAFYALNPERPGIFYGLQANFPDGLSPESREFHQKFTAANLAKYPSWPELWHVAALVAADQSAIPKIQKALKLNGKNFLDWHFELLILLDKYGQKEQISELEKSYYNLITQYLESLRLNAHNTIATLNPQYALNIIDFYQNHGHIIPKTEWDTLGQQMQLTQKEEATKFHLLFP